MSGRAGGGRLKGRGGAVDTRGMAVAWSRRSAQVELAGRQLDELVEEAREGDADAWEVLYRRAHPSLLAYARRRLDDVQAEDAVSETMARAIKSIARFRCQGVDFTGWLFGIHRHVVADAQRARRFVSEPPERASDDPGPLEGLVRQDELGLVRAAFARLTSSDREVLELRVIAGLSADEAAIVLGKRPGAVRTAQSRALDRLRRLLQEPAA